MANQFFTQDYIDFFTELAFNNEKAWFDKNRKRYEASVREPFRAFTEQVIAGVQKFDPTIGDLQPKDVMFRINRDIRFAKDKTPYNTWLSAAIVAGGKRHSRMHPGYYFRFAVDRVDIGGGLFHPDTDTLMQVRRKIATDPKVFRQLLDAEKFKQVWGELRGEDSKVIRKELKQAAEVEPLIRRTSYTYWLEKPEQTILRDDLLEYLLGLYKNGQPLNDYLQL